MHVSMSLLQLPGTSWVDKMICLGAPCFVLLSPTPHQSIFMITDRWAPPWTYGQNLESRCRSHLRTGATKQPLIPNNVRHYLFLTEVISVDIVYYKKRPPLSRIFHLIVLGAPVLRFYDSPVLSAPFSVLSFPISTQKHNMIGFKSDIMIKFKHKEENFEIL